MEIMGNGHSGYSANMANRGGRGGFNCGCGNSGHGRGSGAGRGRGNNGSNNNQRGFNNGGGAGHGNTRRGTTNKVICQVCFKGGHTADRCLHRFEEDFVPDERHISAAMNAYTIDNNWYDDTDATDHNTGELEKLATRERYNGDEQIHAANGAGMHITHVGQSTILSPDHNLHLHNVLHAPSSKKNLVSVHHLTSDNNVFLEFHPNFFLMKDLDTKNVLVKRP
jgi:hypothetical protein